PDGVRPATRIGAMAKVLEGVSFLQRGMADKALQSLSGAQADLTGLVGGGDPTTCLASLNVAIALQATGRTEEAIALAKSVQPVLRSAMGSNAPIVRRASE